MAEVFGTVSAAASLASESLKLYKTLHTFVREVKGADKEARWVVQEVSFTGILLDRFHENVKLEQSMKAPIMNSAFHLRTEVYLSSCRGIFDELRGTITRAVVGISWDDDADPSEFIVRKRDAIRWPFSKEKILDLTQKLQGIKSDLQATANLVTEAHLLRKQEEESLRRERLREREERKRRIERELIQLDSEKLRYRALMNDLPSADEGSLDGSSQSLSLPLLHALDPASDSNLHEGIPIESKLVQSLTSPSAVPGSVPDAPPTMAQHEEGRHVKNSEDVESTLHEVQDTRESSSAFLRIPVPGAGKPSSQYSRQSRAPGQGALSDVQMTAATQQHGVQEPSEEGKPALEETSSAREISQQDEPLKPTPSENMKTSGADFTTTEQDVKIRHSSFWDWKKIRRRSKPTTKPQNQKDPAETPASTPHFQAALWAYDNQMDWDHQTFPSGREEVHDIVSRFSLKKKTVRNYLARLPPLLRLKIIQYIEDLNESQPDRLRILAIAILPKRARGDEVDSVVTVFGTEEPHLGSTLKDQMMSHREEWPPCILFKDAINRSYDLPYLEVSSWEGMKAVIIQAFENVKPLAADVKSGNFQLFGPRGNIILPSLWNHLVRPRWSVTMQMHESVDNKLRVLAGIPDQTTPLDSLAFTRTDPQNHGDVDETVKQHDDGPSDLRPGQVFEYSTEGRRPTEKDRPPEPRELHQHTPLERKRKKKGIPPIPPPIPPPPPPGMSLSPLPPPPGISFPRPPPPESDASGPASNTSKNRSKMLALSPVVKDSKSHHERSRPQETPEHSVVPAQIASGRSEYRREIIERIESKARDNAVAARRAQEEEVQPKAGDIAHDSAGEPRMPRMVDLLQQFTTLNIISQPGGRYYSTPTPAPPPAATQKDEAPKSEAPKSEAQESEAQESEAQESEGP